MSHFNPNDSKSNSDISFNLLIIVENVYLFYCLNKNINLLMYYFTAIYIKTGNTYF